jgi:hypothetical protein
LAGSAGDDPEDTGEKSQSKGREFAGVATANP